MMDRRKTLVVGGGVLAAAVAVGALAGSVGIFGLSDDPPRVGKLSPIDATRSTSVTRPGSDDDTPGATTGTAPTITPGATTGTTSGATPNTAGSPPTTAGTAPSGDDNSGPGSSSSGDDDGSGSGHDQPDDD